MQVVAMVNNKPKVLDVPELAAHITAKSNRQMHPTNPTSCATDLIAHPGGAVAGGALGGGVNYKGAPIYHVSRNFGGAAQGCTVFFADTGGGTAKIIAIGAHIGQAGPGHPTYLIDWVTPDWGGAMRWPVGGHLQL